jgi:hypothetical protein
VKKLPALCGNRKFITATQESTTSPYPEPDQSSPCPPIHFSMIHFNLIHPSKPGSSKWSPSLRLLHQNHVCTSSLPYVLHALPICLLDMITRNTFQCKIEFINNTIEAKCYSPVLIICCCEANHLEVKFGYVKNRQISVCPLVEYTNNISMD